jgi:hypothetical protein
LAVLTIREPQLLGFVVASNEDFHLPERQWLSGAAELDGSEPPDLVGVDFDAGIDRNCGK